MWKQIAEKTEIIWLWPLLFFGLILAIIILPFVPNKFEYYEEYEKYEYFIISEEFAKAKEIHNIVLATLAVPLVMLANVINFIVIKKRERLERLYPEHFI